MMKLGSIVMTQKPNDSRFNFLNVMQTRCSSLFDMTKTADTTEVYDLNELSFITK